MKFTKQQTLTLVIFNLIIIMLGAYVIFSDSSELKDIERTFFDVDEIPTVKICDFHVNDVGDFESQFRSRKQIKKTSGSSPQAFFILTISNTSAQKQMYIGQDSSDPSLFWIYPLDEPVFISQLAFINLHIDVSQIECKSIAQSWVVKTFLWSE
jgi:hypothetical protein